MTPDERRRQSRDALDEWRAAHGAPPWRGWAYANEDPLVLTPVWMLVMLALIGLGAHWAPALIVPFVVLVAQVHISRAIRKRRDGDPS